MHRSGTTEVGETYSLKLEGLNREGILVADTPGILEAGVAGDPGANNWHGSWLREADLLICSWWLWCQVELPATAVLRGNDRLLSRQNRPLPRSRPEQFWHDLRERAEVLSR